MRDARDHAVEQMLDEVLGGRRPPDLSARIAEAVARADRVRAEAAPSRTRRALAVLAVCAAVVLAALWLSRDARPAEAGALRVAVASGSVEWRSGADAWTAGAGTERDVAPRAGDRVRCASTTELHIEGLGTLRCATLTELEVLDMKWRKVGAGVVAGALTLAVIFGSAEWLGGDEPVTVDAGGRIVAEPTTAADATAEPARRVPPAPGTDPARSPVPVETRLARVHGRCVDGSGEPVIGCRVELLERVKGPPPTWRYHRVTTAQPDGRFQWELDAAAGDSRSLSFAATDVVPMECSIDPVEPGQIIDVGTIELQRGIRVHGFVVDEQEAPVQGLMVRFDATAQARRADRVPSPVDYAFGSTDPQGRFKTGPMRSERYRVRLEDDRLASLVSPASIEVRDAMPPVAIVVRRRGADDLISGVVVDEAGEPVAEVSLRATGRQSIGYGDESTSNSKGEFAIVRRRSQGQRAVLSVFLQNGGFTLVGEPVETEWGTRNVRLVVRRPSRVVVAVVEAGSGRPVTAFALRCFPKPLRSWSQSMLDLRQDGTHEGGRATLDDIGAGAHELYVYPRDPDLVPSAAVPFEVIRPGQEVRVELARRTHALRVRAAARDGTPRSGLIVRLVRWEGPSGPKSLQVPIGTVEEAFTKFFSTGMWGLVIDHGTTDGEGWVELRAPPHPAGYALHLPGPGHVPLLRDDVHLGGPVTEIEIPIQIGATLHGRLGPPDTLATLLGARHVSSRDITISFVGAAGQGRFPVGILDVIRVGEDGRFRCDGMPPGSWKAHLTLTFDIGGPTRETLEVGTIDSFADGETRNVELDVRGVLPGTLRGQVFLDGKPYVNRPVLGRGRGTHTDAEGRFALTVSAGKLRLGILPNGVAPESPAAQRTIALDEVEVPPGGEVERVFQAVHRTLTLRILEADGTPARARRVSTANMLDLEPDDDGLVRIDPAPADAIRIRTLPRGMTWATALNLTADGPTRWEELEVLLATDLRMPEGEKHPTIELRIPAGR